MTWHRPHLLRRVPPQYPDLQGVAHQSCCSCDSPTIDGEVQTVACMFKGNDIQYSGQVLFYQEVKALSPMFSLAGA